MNRRSFITGIIAACVAPQFLAGAGRKWRTSSPFDGSADIKQDIRFSKEDPFAFYNQYLARRYVLENGVFREVGRNLPSGRLNPEWVTAPLQEYVFS